MIRDILLLHHSHTDVGYTHYPDTVFARNREFIRRALALAERYAGGQPGEQFKWTCETTIMVQDFLRHATPDEIDRLQALHRLDLISFAGMYCNVTPLYSAEMLSRTFYAAGSLRRDYGFDVRYALNCDVNGQSWGLVEMLLDAGFDGIGMAINRVMARDPQPRPTGFRWQGPSGRRILTWHGEHYGEGNNYGIPRFPIPGPGKRIWKTDFARTREAVQSYTERLLAKNYRFDFAFFQIIGTFMWDNDGPDEDLVLFVREWNQRGWQPRLQIVTLDELFERLRQQPDLETRLGDWTDWWAQGVASSAYETALARQVQERLSTTQKLAAGLQGLAQPTAYSIQDDNAAWHYLMNTPGAPARALRILTLCKGAGSGIARRLMFTKATRRSRASHNMR